MIPHRNWHRQVAEILVKDIDSEEAREEIMQLYDDLSDEEKAPLNKTPESLEREISHVTGEWWRYATQYDAPATLVKVKCPVLAINGSKDKQVSASENLAIIEEALQEGGNTNFMVKEMEGMNHLFQTAGSGDESEYIKIEETMSPVAMGLISGWILKQAGRE
jgi:fermentation-respiration switch protein FrsA (DUF1100 family)